ncbi:hypothetical protein ABTX77_37360 [Streptomyces sp. NPDC097704]|uniref:alpha/beta hydrolase family protein n=1 Tax=Streptomyces sp. NPDC097704 TaxID=3157101 RepID=UPI003329C04C
MAVTDEGRLRSKVTETFGDCVGRVADVHFEERLSEEGEAVGVVTFGFTAEDQRGVAYPATARIVLPAGLDIERPGSAPVWFNCGYELPEEAAIGYARRGWIVVTPCEPAPGDVFPGPNPLVRGPATEFVLAHLVRRLPFVDPAAIVYAGGSAGGFTALLVAAESFPAAAAVPIVPVVDLVRQGAHLFGTLPLVTSDPPPDHPAVPLLQQVIVPIAEGWRLAYGDDLAAPGWSDHSPVRHVPRITCPVAAVFSSADFLVPLEQVGAGLALTSASTAAPASPRLVDVLGEDVDVRVLAVPPGTPAMEDLDPSRPMHEIPLPVPDTPADGRRWLIAVVDEGPPAMGGHWRHPLAPDLEPFARRALAEGIGVDQLTPAKLDQLLDRHQGIEWLAPGFHRLDRPEAERRDVEHGLRTYCAQSVAHARHFADLYERVAPERRVLPDELLHGLLGASA